MLTLAFLILTAIPADIANAAPAQQAVSQSAAPFVGSAPSGESSSESSFAGRLNAATHLLQSSSGGADRDVAASWPDEFDARGLRQYQSAKYTQNLSNFGPRPALRRLLLRRWQVPGGLEFAQGWRSELYRNAKAERVLTWKQGITVNNGSGFTQVEEGYVRKYPVGAVFVDKLSFNSRVFEVRKREVVMGEFWPFWESSVVYTSERDRPPGYVPVSAKACNKCHNESGTGGYAVGLVPGGDTVISDPIAGLEAVMSK